MWKATIQLTDVVMSLLIINAVVMRFISFFSFSLSLLSTFLWNHRASEHKKYINSECEEVKFPAVLLTSKFWHTRVRYSKYGIVKACVQLDFMRYMHKNFVYPISTLDLSLCYNVYWSPLAKKGSRRGLRFDESQ